MADTEFRTVLPKLKAVDNGDGTYSIAASLNSPAAYPTGRTATYVVVASDAPAHVKAQADYVCDGTADNVEIQAAIDALPAPTVVWTNGVEGGSSIVLSQGTFYIASTITLNRPALLIKGQGIANTVLKEANGADCDVISFGTTALACGLHSITLSGFKVDGNSDNNASGNGIDFSAAKSCRMVNIYIDHANESGFYSNSVGTDLVYFDRCESSCAGECNWKITSGAQIYLNQCYSLLSLPTKYGFYFYACSAVYMQECTHDGGTGATGSGMHLFNSHYVDINGCDFYGIANAHYGIDIQSTSYDIKIHGCSFRGQATATFAIGWTLWASDTYKDLIISDNYIGTTFVYGLYFAGGGGGGATMSRFQILNNNIYNASPLYIDTANITIRTDNLISGNRSYIASGEIRTASGSLTGGAANAILFAWHNPEAQDIFIKKVIINITTPDADAANIDVGIADDATYTNGGTEFFNDLKGETIQVNDSWTTTEGTQTLWVLCQDSASATDGWVVAKILDADGSSIAGSYYIEYVGK